MTLIITPETQINHLIGQMTQVEKNSIQPEHVTEYFIGSILSGGGGNPAVNNAGNLAGNGA